MDPVAACGVWEANKNVKKRGVFHVVFGPLGLDWAQAGSATSKVGVLSRRDASFFKGWRFAWTRSYVLNRGSAEVEGREPQPRPQPRRARHRGFFRAA